MLLSSVLHSYRQLQPVPNPRTTNSNDVMQKIRKLVLTIIISYGGNLLMSCFTCLASFLTFIRKKQCANTFFPNYEFSVEFFRLKYAFVFFQTSPNLEISLLSYFTDNR